MLKITISITAQLLHQHILFGDLFPSFLLPVIRPHGSNTRWCFPCHCNWQSWLAEHTVHIQQLCHIKHSTASTSTDARGWVSAVVPCKGCLTLKYVFKEQEGPCVKKTSSLVLRKKLSQELFVPKHSVGNPRAPPFEWGAHRPHTARKDATALSCFGTPEL